MLLPVVYKKEKRLAMEGKEAGNGDDEDEKAKEFEKVEFSLRSINYGTFYST